MNLTRSDKESIKRGDMRLLKSALAKELEHTKNQLIDLPVEKVEELRGKATSLREILNLLP